MRADRRRQGEGGGGGEEEEEEKEKEMEHEIRQVVDASKVSCISTLCPTKNILRMKVSGHFFQPYARRVGVEIYIFYTGF
jgi:hypothetical protein